MSVATQSSLTPVSSSALWRRLASRAALLDLGLAIAGEVPERPDRLGRHEARAQEPGLGELGEPRRVGDVGLSAGDLLDVAGVHEQQLEVVLEHRPHRLPEDAGGLHRDLGDPVGGQPVAQRQDAYYLVRRRLASAGALTVCCERRIDARRDGRLPRQPRPSPGSAPKGPGRTPSQPGQVVPRV